MSPRQGSGIHTQVWYDGCIYHYCDIKWVTSQIARFMGLTWGPPGPCRPHVGPMNLAIKDSISNNQQLDWLFNNLFRLPTKHCIWCKIFFHKQGQSPLKDWQQRHVLMADVPVMMQVHESSQPIILCDAGARELSANHTLWCMTTLLLIGSWLSVALFGNGSDDGHVVKIYKIHPKEGHPLKIVSQICWWKSKEIR